MIKHWLLFYPSKKYFEAFVWSENEVFYLVKFSFIITQLSKFFENIKVVNLFFQKKKRILLETFFC